MATLVQLRNEGPWWNAETMSPTMQKLAERLRLFYGVGPMNIGAKGDTAPGHMQGAHRSRAWIKNSQYCTNRIYTVTETQGNRTGGDDNWLAGMDITVPAAQLIPMCQRLDAAVRAGKLEKITEWYGNDDGDLRVDGYNNIRNQIATSDASHLWHLHLTFDRGRAGEDHTDVFQVLTGTAPTTRRIDMPGLFKTPDNATIYMSDGFKRKALTGAMWADFKKTWGDVPVATVADMAALEAIAGPDWTTVVPPSGGGLTYEQTVQAAKEGANLAEDS